MFRSLTRGGSRCLALALAGLSVGATEASAGSFDCQGAITDRAATSIMGARADVVRGGGAVDDCGVDARGYQHIIISGYAAKRSFFNRIRHSMRSGTRTGQGIRSRYERRTLRGFGGPAFSVDIERWDEEQGAFQPAQHNVFAHVHGRHLAVIAHNAGTAKLASVRQLVLLARRAARSM